MEVILEENNIYILRFDRGEELVESLLSFCREREILSAWVEGLGATDKTQISLYDLKTQTYLRHNLEEDFEILSLTGNIALVEGKPLLHAHVTLGKDDTSVVGGHLHALRVSGTAEIKITKFENVMERLVDPKTGLKLLHRK
jgi:hypothetical protein